MVNDGSLLVSQNQDIYVGGVTGLVIFKEKDLLQTPIKPSKIWFNNLYVNNIEVNTSDPDNILNKNISFTNNIKLKHDYNVFSIQIATDNYIKSNILNIQYRLIGYNDKWLTLNDHQMPTYTPPETILSKPVSKNIQASANQSTSAYCHHFTKLGMPTSLILS